MRVRFGMFGTRNRLDNACTLPRVSIQVSVLMAFYVMDDILLCHGWYALICDIATR